MLETADVNKHSLRFWTCNDMLLVVFRDRQLFGLGFAAAHARLEALFAQPLAKVLAHFFCIDWSHMATHCMSLAHRNHLSLVHFSRCTSKFVFILSHDPLLSLSSLSRRFITTT
jgi:hypothetical protein